ncbi:hypothetical protein [Streptococcus dentiloxodontae]
MNKFGKESSPRFSVKLLPVILAFVSLLIILVVYFAIFGNINLPISQAYIRKIFVGNLWLWVMLVVVTADPFMVKRGLNAMTQGQEDDESDIESAGREIEQQMRDNQWVPLKFRLITLLIIYATNVTFSAIYYYPQQIANTDYSYSFAPSEVMENGQFNDSKFASALGSYNNDQGSITVIYFDSRSDWLQKNQFKLKSTLGSQTVWVAVNELGVDVASLNLQGTNVTNSIMESENNPYALNSNKFSGKQLSKIAGSNESIKTYPYAVRYVSGHVYKLGYIISPKVGQQLLKIV